MSVAQASGAYKASQKRMAREAILQSLPESTKTLWKEFSSTPYWDKRPHKLGLDICVVCLIVYFFFKRELISFKKGRQLFINFINKSNKKYKELSENEEIISTLNLFKQKGVAWGY